MPRFLVTKKETTTFTQEVDIDQYDLDHREVGVGEYQRERSLDEVVSDAADNANDWDVACDFPDSEYTYQEIPS